MDAVTTDYGRRFTRTVAAEHSIIDSRDHLCAVQLDNGTISPDTRGPGTFVMARRHLGHSHADRDVDVKTSFTFLRF